MTRSDIEFQEKGLGIGTRCSLSHREAQNNIPGVCPIACSFNIPPQPVRQDGNGNKGPTLGLPEAPPSLVRETDVKLLFV